MTRLLLDRLRRFGRDCAGVMTIEAVLVLPFLLWGFVALYVFFDAFRQQGINLKASYTVADMLSRKSDDVDMAYVNGLQRVLDFLTNSPVETEVRITVVRYDGQNDALDLDWSATSGSHGRITDANFALIADEIPMMADGDSVIVVETWMTYRPFIDVGVPETDMYNLIVTSPRFSPQLTWEGPGV